MTMAKRLKIKICGMKDPRNIRDVARLAPDYMGFIFFDRSPRCCKGIDRVIIASLPEGITPVMVTVNMPFDEIVDKAVSLGFTVLQFHGDESPEECRRLRENGFKVWKAIPVASADSFKGMETYVGCVDKFLLDTSSSSRGGTGKKFDWKLLDSYDFPVDFMLSGGIGEEDAPLVLELSHPRFSGIDINSRFETSPGVKDLGQLTRFINTIRKKIYE